MCIVCVCVHIYYISLYVLTSLLFNVDSTYCFTKNVYKYRFNFIYYTAISIEILILNKQRKLTIVSITKK